MSNDTTAGRDASRRRVLQATGTAAVAVSVAGCTGDDEPSDEPTTETAADTEDATPEEVGDEDVPRGGNFRYGMASKPAGLNPLATSSAYSWTILDLVYESGTVTDPVTFEVRPWVYTDWTVEGADTDSPSVYVDVRDGLTFTDGEELTVEDVVFTYEYLNDQQPGRYASTVEPVAGVARAEGDWDVRLDLSRPVGTYDSDQLQVPILPKHVWEEVDSYSEYEPFENGGPVGLGPARVTRYEPDTTVEAEIRDVDEYALSELDWLQEHPNLRAGGPFVDGVRYMIYGSSEALQQAFLQEDAVDAVYGSIQPSNVSDVEEKAGAAIVTGSDTGYNYYAFNMRNAPLDCTSFRQVLGFAFDSVFWTQQLNRNTERSGDFVMPPGYEAVRPESAVEDATLTEHPATDALEFLQSQPGVLNVDAVKAFLRNGEVIDGEAGSVADGEREYPGSLTGVTAAESEARHEYTWGPVESDVLADEPGVDEEIRVDGETIPELMGRPLRMLMYPPSDTPLTTQMVKNYVGQLKSIGVPVEREVVTFNTMIDQVYRDVDFDVYPMSWTNLSPFATASLNSLFHSDQAHGPDSAHEAILNNPMGYGLEGLPGADDLIDETLEEMDGERRNDLARRTVEKIYLDAPTIVNSYEIPQWAVNSGDFDGFVNGIPSPGGSYVHWQFHQVHQRE